ncbi:hypothetical protein [Sorangium sp. So ce542]|uniref:hypothetical protein n=1 Tax=Sorangium sp. So ce542 TaxID=3133316 RepID=UPI003F617458
MIQAPSVRSHAPRCAPRRRGAAAPTALLAWLQLGEAVSARTAAARFVLLAGVTIVATAPSPPAAAAQPAPPPPDGGALAPSTGLPLLAANGAAPSRPPARGCSIKA